MAKYSVKKKSQSVSIDSIYAMLKEKKLTEDLWLELLTDLKEKPTFKKIKEMVASVFTDKLKGYEQKLVDRAERSQRRAQFAEISILAYTIDRVLSNVLQRRLYNELIAFIAEMIEEFQKIPIETKPVPSFEVHAMLENIESIFTEKSANGKGKVAKDTETSINDLLAQNFGRKRGRPPKAITVVKEEVEDSDGNVSMESISSVKTEDLSSFDDNISVDTVENIGKKKTIRRKKIVPVQKANTMLAEGNISKIYQVQKIAEQIEKTQNQKTPVKVLPQRKRKPNSKYNTETMVCNVKDYASDRSSSSDTTDHTPNVPSQTDQKAKRRKTDQVEIKKETDQVEIKKKTGSGQSKKTYKSEMKKVSSPNIVYTRSANIASSSDKSSSGEVSDSASPTKMQNTSQRYDTADLYKPRFHFGKA
ncbi:hypothetical protein JTE90_008923 [Oedothorax gibbosus]|uniref:Uncharacterized protein n=1 Tax=Oedothorax gibbosus TaxID=931172 RepID=A0AAV6UPV5_9ARAC|nr:hypothetical protein JTE90_008923 [Oedothorax gibbosus]